MKNQKLLTLGDLVHITGQAEHRVKYAINAYGIEPTQRAGVLRLWTQDDVPLVRAALDRIAANRPALTA